MLQAGDRARRDARSAFEVFRGNAGQRHAPDLVARRFPSLPRHPQHRALSRPGVPDHDTEIASVREMPQRIGLLAGKDKAARFGTRQCRLSVPVTDLVAFPFRHQLGGLVQAPFGLDHVACGEAILTASVSAEFDQIGRVTHRAHHLVELLDPVAVPVRKLRQIAPREGRSLLRDRVQPERGIGDDFLAIAACNLAVHLGAVGLAAFLSSLALNAPILNAFGGRADLALRLQRNALGFEGAMVDPRVDIEFGQTLIGKLRPAFAPALDQLGAVPVSSLLAKAILVHRSHRQHDMGVGFWHAVLADIPMHIEIGDHAMVHELRLREVARELNALRLRQFARNSELHLAGKLGVLADLERLDVIPEPFTVAPCLRCFLWQQHLGMDDAALGGEIMAAVESLVAQP